MKETQINSKSWLLHLAIVLLMYGYYSYLWYGYLFYEGKPGWNGYELFMMTLVTAPAYIIFHLAAIYAFKSSGRKKSLRVTQVGLIACIIHTCTMVAII